MSKLQLFTNNATTTIAVGISAGDTSITLANATGSKFPTITSSNFFLATIYTLSGTQEINHEIVKVTARSGDVLTVTRAQEGTTARAWSAGAFLELRFTAGHASLLSNVTTDAGGNGYIGIGKGVGLYPTTELDVSGTFRVTAQGTNYISGDTGSAALEVVNPGAGAAIQSDGDISFPSSGSMLLADFSSATRVDRFLFKTATTNGDTGVGARPDGSGTRSSWDAYAGANVDASAVVSVGVSTALGAAFVDANRTGAASYLALQLRTSNTIRVYVDSDGDVGIGTNAPSGRFHVQGGRSVFSAATEVYALQVNNADGSLTGPWIGSPSANVFQVTANSGIPMLKLDGSGSGPRIIADFDNATLLSRAHFQTSGSNAATSLGIIPSGSGTTARLNIWNNSDPTNAGRAIFAIDPTNVVLRSDISGTGTYLPLVFFTSGAECARFGTDGQFETIKGMKASRSSSGATMGDNRFLHFYDANGNSNQKNWIVYTHKDASYDQLNFGTLSDAGAAQAFIIGFHQFSGGAAIDIALGSATKIYDSDGNSRSNSTYHKLAVLEVDDLHVQDFAFLDVLETNTMGFSQIYTTSTSTTTHTLSLNLSQYHKINMGHNIATLTITAPNLNCVCQCEFIQDATGSRTMVWPASLKWPANYLTVDKTLSTAANSRDLLILRWNGTDYVANLMKGIA
jgi:hypothetical protein